jgi:hypothetical protein
MNEGDDDAFARYASCQAMRALATLGIAFTLLVGGVTMSGLLNTIFIVAAIIAFLMALVVWIKDKNESDSPEEPQRIGYLGREGSKGNLRRAKFGKDLDTAIDNAGEVDAEEAEFSAG